MRPKFLVMLTMSLSGLLFGIAGSTEILGVSHFMIPTYGTSIGFDAIAVALLGRSQSRSGSRLRPSCSARSARRRRA